ncbi:sulfite exporter TauE/SafE family protein [Curtobacterium sp. VKM Ac-2922]|uniref:sulfite exporter TauE/SafE family protein n=1 Tax=Curtobacterium sp. VKM Ac-2922 TaxID=2929475 RepID=UPI001FB1A94F|nr:sulfite exporter TauE/SafE family protein [Curtobacterium sp. VKM Ac-2922]MCJ1713746.1 sulfite exporter TauE/SafE family protein [Curtobacterium sp. VKM Ac-2922]
MTVLTAAFLLLAGVLAGVIGTAGGITSLVAYPALLAVGVPPFAANVTNSVALLGSGASSALRARRDLVGHGATLRRWAPVTVLVSAAGAVLLLVTPTHVFDRVVPYLVALGSVLLLVQPWIDRRRASARLRPVAATASVSAVSLYNGYFGAGAGVLMIAVMLLDGEPVLHRANALKNVLLVAADVVPAVLFAVSGAVVWAFVWPLGLGAVVGGLIGPSVARRVPQTPLRIGIAVCGFVLAGYLLVAA